jgi:hypothetical protein
MRGWAEGLLRIAVVVCVLTLTSATALAIGWDNDDFLVIGAPNFSQYIGVFDRDFTFKGYLETNFLGVRGMDFDPQGRLVAMSYLNPEVRVYNPDGSRAGGFTQATSPMLRTDGQLDVAPDGNYVIGTAADGVRVFTPQGTFVRQYGTGRATSNALVPGNRLWTAAADATVNIFDFDTGAQVGTFTTAGQLRAGTFVYSAFSNTVLMNVSDSDAGGVYERDLAGNLLHEFHLPHSGIATHSAVRMAGGDVYGTHDWYAPSYPDLIHWGADGAVLEERAIWPVEIKTGEILWAGSVPEPGGGALLALGINLFSFRPGRRPRVRVVRRGRKRGHPDFSAGGRKRVHLAGHLE